MIKLLNLFFLLFLFSCSSNDHWNDFKADGLPDRDENYEDILFYNDSSGYLGGDRTIVPEETSDSHLYSNRTVLYKTTDRGKSWKQIPLDTNGSVSKIFCFHDTLIVLLQDVSTDTSHILQSTNGGNTWSSLLSFIRKNYIRDIYFESPDQGFIATDNRESQQLLQFNKNKWDTVLKLSNESYRHKIFNDRIISLLGNTNEVLITDYRTLKQTVVPFDSPYFVGSLTRDKNTLLFACHDSLTGKILRLTNDKFETISLGQYSNYFPQTLFAYGNTIMAIVYQREDVAFLGVIHSLLITHDAGKTWKLEDLPSSLSAEPAFMYKDRFFISSCLPPGFIQIRQ